MTEYEVLLLLDPELSDEKQTEIVGRVRTLVEQGGGTFERHDPWGRRKLAYPIDKKEDGSYHLLTFSTTAETLVPGFATEGARAVMSAFSIAVKDLGPDGSLAPSVSPGLDCPPICGSGDETKYLEPGDMYP